MIDYTRTRWYGLEYMFRWRGILLPRLLPVMLVSVAISAIVASEVAGDMCDQDSDNPLFQHPYAFQLFGIGFGYLSVARLNISYARYWEGVTQIKIMHSKWADAIIQILAFDRIDRDDTEITEEPFCVHITRLFIQLSALATMHLHEEALPTLEQHHSAMASLHSAEKKLAGMVTSAAGAALHTGKQLGQLGLMRRHSSSPTVGTLGKSKTKPKIEPEKQKKNRQSLLGKFSSKRETMAAEKKAEADGDIRGSYMAEEDLSHHRLFDPEEIALFHAVPDKIHAQISRIIRTITTRQAAGGIKAPPPIVSRVFQELSNGVLAYNNACKMKEVPVPFALVHFNALLLLFFIVTAPLVVSCFTGHPAC